MHYEHILNITLKLLGVIALLIFILLWVLVIVGGIIGAATVSSAASK